MQVDRVRHYLEKYCGNRGARLVGFHDRHLTLMLQAPAAVRNHHWWDGGYYDHVSECFYIAQKLYRTFEHRQPPFTLESALVVLYFHDIRKMWKYSKGLPDDFNVWDYYESTLLRDEDIAFSPEEHNALAYVHGEGTDYCPLERMMCPLSAFCHSVDTLSSRLWHDWPVDLSHTEALDVTADDKAPGWPVDLNVLDDGDTD